MALCPVGNSRLVTTIVADLTQPGTNDLEALAPAHFSVADPLHSASAKIAR